MKRKLSIIGILGLLWSCQNKVDSNVLVDDKTNDSYHLNGLIEHQLSTANFNNGIAFTSFKTSTNTEMNCLIDTIQNEHYCTSISPMLKLSLEQIPNRALTFENRNTSNDSINQLINEVPDSFWIYPTAELQVSKVFEDYINKTYRQKEITYQQYQEILNHYFNYNQIDQLENENEIFEVVASNMNTALAGSKKGNITEILKEYEKLVSPLFADVFDIYNNTSHYYHVGEKEGDLYVFVLKIITLLSEEEHRSIVKNHFIQERVDDYSEKMKNWKDYKKDYPEYMEYRYRYYLYGIQIGS